MWIQRETKLVKAVAVAPNKVYTGMELGVVDGAVQDGKDIVASNAVKVNIENSRLISATVVFSTIKNCPVSPNGVPCGGTYCALSPDIESKTLSVAELVKVAAEQAPPVVSNSNVPVV